MMMAGKPKAKLATVIIDHMSKPDFAQGIGEPGKDKPVDMNKPQDDSEMGLDASAEKMMSALKSDDAKAFKSALLDFLAMAPDEDDSEENDSEEGE